MLIYRTNRGVLVYAYIIICILYKYEVFVHNRIIYILYTLILYNTVAHRVCVCWQISL